MTASMLEMPTTQEIDQALEKILSRAEFATPGLSFLQRIWISIRDKILELLGKVTEMTGIPTVYIVVFSCIALAVISIILFRAVRNRRLRRRVAPLQAKEVSPSVNPWRAAEDLAGRLDFTAAFIWLFLAHLNDLESHNLISLHKSKTTLHYEFELIQAGFAQIGEYRALKHLYNAARYGNRRISREDFDLWLSYCLRFVPREGAA